MLSSDLKTSVPSGSLITSQSDSPKHRLGSLRTKTQPNNWKSDMHFMHQPLGDSWVKWYTSDAHCGTCWPHQQAVFLPCYPNLEPRAEPRHLTERYTSCEHVSVQDIVSHRVETLGWEVEVCLTKPRHGPIAFIEYQRRTEVSQCPYTTPKGTHWLWEAS